MKEKLQDIVLLFVLFFAFILVVIFDRDEPKPEDFR
jgi:hypothetical protein